VTRPSLSFSSSALGPVRRFLMGSSLRACAALFVLALSSAACTTLDQPPTPQHTVAPPTPVDRILSVPSPPEWRPGDRWTYDLTSGNDRGAKTMEVVEVREVASVPYYVVRLGDVDHYYTRNLYWAAAIRDSKVEARMTPPHQGFVWPLEVGKRWTYQGIWQDQNSHRDLNDRFAVVGVEMVDVLAGRFETLKIVREGSTSGSDEYWFAPAVRSYVRWVGRRGDVQFEERLREYRPAPRLIPERIVPGPSSK
jgi:hypothetical protein